MTLPGFPAAGGTHADAVGSRGFSERLARIDLSGHIQNSLFGRPLSFHGPCGWSLLSPSE